MKTLAEALKIYSSIRDCPDLEKRAQAIAQALDGLTGEDAIATIAKLEEEYLLTRFIPNSIGTKMSQAGYNKLIRKIPLVDGQNSQQTTKQDGSTVLKHWFFKYCGLSKHEFYPNGEVANAWDERNASNRVYKRLQGNIEIAPEEQIKAGYQLLQSGNPWEVATGLIALSGRRPHEIVARAKFTQIEGEEYKVEFQGQGKKRGEEPVFPISILVPVDIFLKAFKQFRSNPDVKEVLKTAKNEASNDIAKQNRIIDKLTNKRLNRIVKRDFAIVLPPRVEADMKSEDDEADINCTALKSAYLAMATERDCEGSPARKMLFASKLAGHFIDVDSTNQEAIKRIDNELRHLVTTLGYMSYHVKGNVPFFKPPEVTHTPHSKLPLTRLRVEDGQQLDAWCKLWDCSKVDAMSKIFELARQALSTPTTVPEPTKETEAMDNTAVKELEQKMQAYQERTEARFNELMQLLAGKQEIPIQETETNDEVSPMAKPATGEVISGTPTKVSKKPTRDWESVSKEELFGTNGKSPAKGTGATEERIERTVNAIMAWNNQFPHDQNPERKWSINNRAVRDLSGVNGIAVKEWLEKYHGKVSDHNHKHSITDQYHNRCHKAEGKTSADLIREEVYPLIK
ncbi:MAG TPA: protelomerase family protein [Waterburya sp.]|jgi:hypothetical protein